MTALAEGDAEQSAPVEAYLDCNASAPLHPAVLEAMLPWLGTRCGNPSNVQHRPGREARDAVARARRQVATAIGAKPEEIIFTGGASEANSQVILGLRRVDEALPSRIITSAVEHPSVRESCRYARELGATVEVLRVDEFGMVPPTLQVESDRRTLVSVMMVQNETGTIEPVTEIAAQVASAGGLMHSDAVQALGRIALDVGRLPLHALSLSAHKAHGPKGVGALFVRKGCLVEPRIFGGGQERGARAGTENVAGVVGFGVACELVTARLNEDVARMTAQLGRLEAELLTRIPETVVFVPASARVCNTLSVAWAGLDHRTLLPILDRHGVFAASGSACSGRRPSSRVLEAMGIDERVRQGAVRLSISRTTTDAEIEHSVGVIGEVVRAQLDALRVVGA